MLQARPRVPNRVKSQPRWVSVVFSHHGSRLRPSKVTTPQGAEHHGQEHGAAGHRAQPGHRRSQAEGTGPPVVVVRAGQRGQAGQQGEVDGEALAPGQPAPPVAGHQAEVDDDVDEHGPAQDPGGGRRVVGEHEPAQGDDAGRGGDADQAVGHGPVVAAEAPAGQGPGQGVEGADGSPHVPHQGGQDLQADPEHQVDEQRGGVGRHLGRTQEGCGQGQGQHTQRHDPAPDAHGAGGHVDGSGHGGAHRDLGQAGGGPDHAEHAEEDDDDGAGPPGQLPGLEGQ